MYSKLPNLVIGFHGCDKEIYDNVLHRHQEMTISNNTYDWLGNGIYFWENNYERAFDWANHHRKISTPAVIGAVIDLGHCLNLTDYKSSDILRSGHEILKAHITSTGQIMPENKNIGGNEDLLLRDLDCAVIQTLHQFNIDNQKSTFDSVRGVFIEGGEVYPNSGFRDKTHIQICICNPNCIKGYFSPKTIDSNYLVP